MTWSTARTPNWLGHFRPLPKHGFVYARLVPIRPVSDAWLVSGSMRAYRKSDAAQVAQVALELAMDCPN